MGQTAINLEIKMKKYNVSVIGHGWVAGAHIAADESARTGKPVKL
jgi:hypothetical protein